MRANKGCRRVSATGQQPNNPGYCFLTFPSPAHAAAILAQVNNGSSSIPMPNSTKPFSLNWASAVPTPIALAIPNNVQQYPKEYSIFVGDLAPETILTSSPFSAIRCKSAKIMLDPVTGVSRGYGFVRFGSYRYDDFRLFFLRKYPQLDVDVDFIILGRRYAEPSDECFSTARAAICWRGQSDKDDRYSVYHVAVCAIGNCKTNVEFARGVYDFGGVVEASCAGSSDFRECPNGEQLTSTDPDFTDFLCSVWGNPLCQGSGWEALWIKQRRQRLKLLSKPLCNNSRRVAGAVDKFKQNKLTDFFGVATEETQNEENPQDIEDIGAEDTGRICITGPKWLFTRAASPEPEEDEAYLSRPLPDPSVNYTAWLKAMRPRWKKQQEARWNVAESATSVVIPSMFATTKVRTGRRWDIVQIRASKTPGRFILWLSIEGELRAMPLQIPREFYIHLKTPEEEAFQSQFYSFEKVTRHLPRDVPCSHLYKISVRENVYHEIQEHFIDLTNDLNIPLVVRGLIKRGRTCMTLNRGQSVGFDLSQLDRAETLSRQKYLDGGIGGKYIFIYHACSANSPLHVFAIFLPSGPDYGSSISVTYPDTLEFSPEYHSTDITALKAISRELGVLEDKSFTVFPVLSMGKSKGAHTLDVFPWKTNVAPKMLHRYLSLGTWLDRLISMSQYYDVPIGHLEDDQALFVSDITFARKLIQQDMVLWWSPGEEPDLGGAEQDKRPVEDFPNSEFSSPDSYSNFCLKITVRNLAVNSVIHSIVVNELEGSGGSTAFDSVSRTLDDRLILATSKPPGTAQGTSMPFSSLESAMPLSAYTHFSPVPRKIYPAIRRGRLAPFPISSIRRGKQVPFPVKPIRTESIGETRAVGEETRAKRLELLRKRYHDIKLASPMLQSALKSALMSPELARPPGLSWFGVPGDMQDIAE
ncbi:hypothetical protein C8J56DRAFT_1083280 [Mycena floridula]|nr:hypothetical protein C8J56DRAFT_1083280 [Mycena floridula]